MILSLILTHLVSFCIGLFVVNCFQITSEKRNYQRGFLDGVNSTKSLTTHLKNEWNDIPHELYDPNETIVLKNVISPPIVRIK